MAARGTSFSRITKAITTTKVAKGRRYNVTVRALNVPWCRRQITTYFSSLLAHKKMKRRDVMVHRRVIPTPPHLGLV